MARVLSNKMTQLIFVPESLMTYFAFEYDDNGNGLSLVIKHKNIGILNSILTLANVNAAINNSIDYKKVNVRFDDQEIDPNKTLDQIITNLARYTTMNGQQLLQTDVQRQYDYLGLKGIQFAFEEHPGFPGTTVDIENLDREKTEPDIDLIEKQENLLIQAMGSTPEVVDMARNVEFATSYFQSNLLAARRAISEQKIITKFCDKFVKVYTLHSPKVLKEMIRTIDKHRSEHPEIKGVKTIVIVKEFIESVATQLPKPDMTKIEVLEKAIEAYEKYLDKLLQYTIGEDYLADEDIGEDLSGALDAVRRKIKGYLMQDYIASNSMFSEGLVKALFTGDKEVIDECMSQIEAQQETFGTFIKDHKVISQKFAQKNNDEFQAVLDSQGVEEGSGSSSSFSSDSGSDDNNNDDTSNEEGGSDDENTEDPFNPPSDGGDGEMPF